MFFIVTIGSYSIQSSRQVSHSLSKDITRVISKVRDRLLEIRVTSFCHTSVNSEFNV